MPLACAAPFMTKDKVIVLYIIILATMTKKAK